MTTPIYITLTHEQWKALEDQCIHFQRVETSHTNHDEHTYHNAFRLRLDDLVMEFVGPTVHLPIVELAEWDGKERRVAVEIDSLTHLSKAVDELSLAPLDPKFDDPSLPPDGDPPQPTLGEELFATLAEEPSAVSPGIENPGIYCDSCLTKHDDDPFAILSAASSCTNCGSTTFRRIQEGDIAATAATERMKESPHD